MKPNNSTAPNKQKTFLKICLLVFTLIFVIGVPLVLRFPVGWDFQNNLWAPAHLLLNRESPYHIQEMIPNSNAVWMPTIIGFFLPLGFLTVEYASNLWVLINLLLLFGIVGFVVENLTKNRLRWFSAAVLVLIFFPPIMTHFVLGQISMLICFLLLLAILYWQRLPAYLLGLIFSLALAKPQLAVFFLPAWLLVVLRQKEFRKAILTGLYTVVWSGIFLVPFYLLYPGWVDAFLFNLATNKDWAHPSFITFLLYNLPVDRFYLILLSMVCGFVIVFFLTRYLSEKRALLWSLALTPLFTPYIWSWDFILIIPLLLTTIFDAEKAIKRWLTALGFLVIEITYIIMKLQGVFSDHLYWWVPWALVALLAVVNLLPDLNPPPKIPPTV